MLETRYRYIIQCLIDAIARCFPQSVKPFHITCIATILGIITSICIVCNFLYIGLLSLWLSGLFDMLDGTIARQRNLTSLSGGYLDLISDRLVECLIILAFSIRLPYHNHAYLLFFVGLLLHFTSFLAFAAIMEKRTTHKGKSIHYDEAIVERAEAFLAFSGMMLLPQYLSIILIVFDICMIYSAFSRIARIIQFHYTYDL